MLSEREAGLSASLLAASIAEVAAKLANITEDLRRMPSWKRLTSYGQDRLGEKLRLMAKLEALRSEERSDPR